MVRISQPKWRDFRAEIQNASTNSNTQVNTNTNQGLIIHTQVSPVSATSTGRTK